MMINQLLLTEKTSQLSENNCYVFLVSKETNKIGLKNFFQSKYDVKVLKVNVLKKQSKKIRRGRVFGRTSSLKKAYVFTDQKVESFEVKG